MGLKGEKALPDESGNLDLLIQKELLFVSGKGGVGKSFTSAWLARYACSKGKNVLLVESGNLSQLGFYFDLSVSLNALTKIDDRLSLLHTDFQGCLEAYVSLRIKKQSVRNAFLSNNRMKSFLDAIPGLPELMMLGRLYYSASRDSSYDLIIYDAPAFGHFLNLMTTLDAIMETGLTGPMLKQVQTIKEFLTTDSQCGSVLVTNPEALVMNETFEFLPKLGESAPVKVDGLVVNRCFEEIPDELLLDSIGSELYNYIDARSGTSNDLQKQIIESARDHAVPVILTLREIGAVAPDTFFEETFQPLSEEAG